MAGGATRGPTARRHEHRHGQTGWLTAFVTYSAVDAAGRVVRWVVAHEHTSTPTSLENQGLSCIAIEISD